MKPYALRGSYLADYEVVPRHSQKRVGLVDRLSDGRWHAQDQARRSLGDYRTCREAAEAVWQADIAAKEKP